MNEYIDLETGDTCRDKPHADELYKDGHRIRVISEGQPVCEWIPGSHDYYTWVDGEKVLRHPSHPSYLKEIIMTDTNTNREIVQEGLDARAEARAEATQEALDAKFLDDLNELTAASRKMTEKLEETQRRAKEQRREKRQEAAEANRRDTFMQRIFTAVAIIAVTIWLNIIEAVAFWLAMTIGIAGLLYIIVNTVGYYTRDNRKEK